MSTGYQIKDQALCYFVTLRIVEWVDIFTRQPYRDLIIENLNYCQQHKQLTIFGYVIMSNHIHMLVRSENEKLSGTLRDFKSYTAKELLKKVAACPESRKEWMLAVFKRAGFKHERNSVFQVWAQNNHAEFVYSEHFIDQKLEYIHQNPVRAGIVEKAEDYLYSSARNYAEEEALLPVTLVSRQWKTY